MRYEVYRNRNSSDDSFNTINQMFKRIMTEDKYLCTQAQENLNHGVFVNGELHPRMEKGPLYFQTVVRDLVQDHHDREKEAGAEIWPARQTLPQTATTSQEDIEFCSKLDAQGQAKGGCGSSGGGCSGMACAPGNEALAY
ncbi:hypothetical protein FE257_006905 [Aspergillus nanangensis]|uniref:Choline monooxygenase, chloroplastic n=1 Tax=Aspergillus nanangensis TaxID=2582783 RepID=A0AAD4CNL7_ASPNN|nr:hypothetical protein FE257_006905 [Aspergillus nanangensis]